MNRGGYSCGEDVDLAEDVHPNFVRMGSRIRIRGGSILFGSAGRPTVMGDDIYINVRCVLHGGAAQLSIGDRVTLAVGVAIHTDSGPNTSAMLQKDFPITAKDVTIEDDVWIGDYAVILPGVTIGHGSVIGAGTVVRRSVPAHTVVAGNPQQVLRVLEKTKQECYACTLRRPQT
jgi:acetyltransferase-like isoleucine patch superfamily enzyme